MHKAFQSNKFENSVVLRVESLFSAQLKFYRTSAEKSTFRTQNDTKKANFRCTVKNKFNCCLFFYKLIII